MVDRAGAPADEPEAGLADSRAQFVASLGRRLDGLRAALGELGQTPRSVKHRDHLRRRIHAFGAAAGVLGFDRVFEAFREAETILGGPATIGPAEIALIARTVDLVPSLVLGSPSPSSRPPSVERRSAGYPTSVLVFGGEPILDALLAAAASAGGGPSLECERTEEPTRAEEIVRVTAPDVAIVDADRRGARELVETLAYDPLLEPVRVIALGTFERPEAAAALVSLGVARVLPKPVSPEVLRRTVVEVARHRATPPERVEPIGDVTVEGLAERLAQEVRRGLVEATRPAGRGVAVALGDGTDVLAAAWSAVARIRELVTLRSGGAVRFEATGPEGAVPLAPWMGDDRARTAGGDRRASDGVSLQGRTIVVADDDPSVVWFLAGLFRAAGATVLEAHDGLRALRLVQRSWPDVVVSDILMPELDGFALCRDIKRDVALGDLPVVLLSWKEDLLQRVRELGADADGYLRKEATASTVVQRVKEVLLPRARVEARLAAGEEARGRLDGLTPRLILDVICRHGRDAHLTVRDAAFLYEVDVRGGRVRTATRTAPDGRAETGERALATLLGVRAGRFAVRRDASPCPEDWDRDLKELLAPSVERARAARVLLADPRRVARVLLDAAALEPYLSATPASVRAVAERLADGASPEQLLGTGVPLSLLESVLVDAILHGAVQGLIGRDGEDLLESMVGGPAPEESIDLAPRDAPAELRAQEGSAPEMTPAPKDTDALAEVLPVPGDVSAADGPAPAPAVAVAAAPEKFESLLLLDSVPPPPASEQPEERPPGTKPAAPVLGAEAPLSPLESAVLSVQPPASARSRFTPSSPPPAVEGVAAFAPAMGSTSRPAVSEGAVGGGAGDVAAQVAAPEPEDASRVADGAAGEAARAADGAAGEAARAADGAAGEAARAADGAAGEAARVADGAAGEAARAADGAGGEAARAAEAGAGSAGVAATGPAIDLGAAIASLGGDQSAPVAPAAPVPTAPAVSRSTRETDGGVPTAPRTTERSAGTERREPSARQASGAPGAARSGQTTRKIARSARPPQEPAGEPVGTLGIAAVVTVAALASFFGVRALRSGGEPAPAAPPLSVSAAAAPGASPGGAVGAPSAVVTPRVIDVKDLELPSGLAVDAERGLLELDVEAGVSLYVDGVLIGPGPFRQVPLREGLHQVRLQGPGIDLSRPVDIRKGRRARVVVASAR